jgi:hypothetical protein
MNTIIKDDINQLAFTLNESGSATNWILQLKYKETGSEVLYLLDQDQDQTLNPLRYNQFDIIDPLDLDLEVGQWDYYVWATGLTAGDPDVLSLTMSFGIVEIGRLNVEN